MAGDIQWSGYKAAAATVLTTEINSLADGSVTALSSEKDNSTDLDVYADVYLELGSINPTGSPFVEIYLFPTVDGTNYPDTSTTYAAHMAPGLVGTIPVSTGSSAKKGILRGVLLPTGKYKWALRNRTGVTLASGSNNLYARIYTDYYA